MAKTDLLKEAIADAKAVRETALANAKIALEEAFTPRIQSMLSAKLSEEEGAEMEEDMEEVPMEEEDAVETNGDGMDAAAGAPVEEEMDEPAMEEDMEEPAMEEDMEEPVDETEDLELEAIIRELEDDMAAEEPVAEQSDSTKIGTGDNKMDVADSNDEEDPGKGKLKENEGGEEEVTENEGEEDVTIDEIIKALKEDEGEEEAVTETEDKEEVTENEEAEKDLEEAYKVIRFLKSKINEVNLLNAKLLFSNKLFRNHSLNEGQKMKVIENFDRAQSLREVKLVFATLSESFNINGKKAKRTIKESYASKPSRSTAPKKQVISEGNQLAARWKKLANL
jgi:flagellar biosynthesis/type III secretory pathway chaperone